MRDGSWGKLFSSPDPNRIFSALAEAKIVGIAGLCQKTGISRQTYYRWKSEYEGLSLEEISRSQYLQAENRRLKRLINRLRFDYHGFWSVRASLRVVIRPKKSRGAKEKN